MFLISSILFILKVKNENIHSNQKSEIKFTPIFT